MILAVVNAADLCNYLRSLKKIQDFNGFWTLDLAIPVWRSSSNQLSYEATDVFSGQVCVHVFPCSSLSREHMNTYFTSSQHQWLHSIAPVSRGHGFKSRQKSWIFFRLLTQLHTWIAFTTAKIILHLIWFPQYSYLIHFNHIHVTMMKSCFVNLM